jgi:hypothetical protein
MPKIDTRDQAGDFTALVDLLSRYAKAKNCLQGLETTAQTEFLIVVDENKPEYARHQQIVTECEARIEVIARRHIAPGDWFDKSRTVKTPFGSVSVRSTTSLAVANEELTIVLIEQRIEQESELYPDEEPSAKLLRTRTELNLEALEKLDDTELARLRIQRVTDDKLTIKPSKIDLRQGSRPEEGGRMSKVNSPCKVISSFFGALDEFFPADAKARLLDQPLRDSIASAQSSPALSKRRQEMILAWYRDIYFTEWLELAGFEKEAAAMRQNPSPEAFEAARSAVDQKYRAVYLAVYRAVDLAVDLAVYRAVYRAVDRAVDLAVYLAVYRAVYLAVYRAVDRAVDRAAVAVLDPAVLRLQGAAVELVRAMIALREEAPSEP